MENFNLYMRAGARGGRGVDKAELVVHVFGTSVPVTRDASLHHSGTVISNGINSEIEQVVRQVPAAVAAATATA